MNSAFRRNLLPLALALAITACSDNDTAPQPDPKSNTTDSAPDPSASATSAISSGETLYRNVCVVCHNADPRERGALGPPVAGASLALLEAKVLRGEYPPGYEPAQDSATMPQFPFVAPKLPDLATYLASIETEKD